MLKRVLVCAVLLIMVWTIALAEDLPEQSVASETEEPDSAKVVILNMENCEDLWDLTTDEYPSAEKMSAFSSKYAGQMISIDGFIYDFEQYGKSIRVQIGDHEEGTYTPAPLFKFERVSPNDLGLEGSQFPEFVQKYGSNVRIVGRVKKYDSAYRSIVLEPVFIEDRDALTEESVSLFDELDTSMYVTLEKGQKGDDVKALQQRLKDLYYLDSKVDGSYGNITKSAVEKFQVAAELEVTGIADPITQAILFSDKAPEAKLNVSCASIIIGSSARTTWYVDGMEFTLTGNKTKTVKTLWGTYRFDAYGNYEKIEK